MRIILYTGKGGVGKTSVAAATACQIAAEGKKVLIVSTDMAHSLSDSFGVKLGSEETKIEENLYGMEIDPVKENENAWGEMKQYLNRLMSKSKNGGIEAEELLVFPGFDELFCLLKIRDLYDENQYDVLIVDCAPTGETLSLLKFPEVFSYWMEKFFPMKRKATKVAGPLIEKTTKIPMPSDSTFDAVEKLYQKLDALQELMLRKDVVSVRIVTTPEKIVIKEAKRNFTYLHLFNYNVDAIIVNKLFPLSSREGYFGKWMEKQKEGIEDIKESFAPIPIFTLPLMSSELRFVQPLKQAGEQLYGATTPESIFFEDKIFELQKEQSGYRLRIHLLFAEKSELDLAQSGDELHLSIKNEKRTILLPQKLHSREITSAKYDSGDLVIHFA
ncbi:MAG: ArsA family ATPase [Lachnospiraceae bacterium]|nr:ArsA family ATPase [Lachnospiraceae bacterium]